MGKPNHRGLNKTECCLSHTSCPELVRWRRGPQRARFLPGKGFTIFSSWLPHLSKMAAHVPDVSPKVHPVAVRSGGDRTHVFPLKAFSRRHKDTSAKPHWLEFDDMTPAICKGCWEVQALFWVATCLNIKNVWVLLLRKEGREDIDVTAGGAHHTFGFYILAEVCFSSMTFLCLSTCLWNTVRF